MDFQIGDIVRVERDASSTIDNSDVPEDWDAIVVDVPFEESIQVAWLTLRRGRFAETYDHQTMTIYPGETAKVTLLRRAVYRDIEVGPRT